MIHYQEINIEVVSLNINDIEVNLSVLSNYLDRVDIIGYACARNSRILENELKEFNNFKNNLLIQYGHKELDDNGVETGSISLDQTDEKYEMAINEYKKIVSLDRDLPIIRIKYTDVIGLLSGNEILQLDWMLED